MASALPKRRPLSLVVTWVPNGVDTYPEDKHGVGQTSLSLPFGTWSYFE